jgi:hypothetical protein
LDQSKFGANLNPFEINLIRFENRIGRTMLPTPPVSAAPTASLRRTQPLTIGPPSRPDPPVSRVNRVAPTPPSSIVTRQRADDMPPHCSTQRPGPPLSPSLSFALPPCGVHPLGPPPRRFPLKRSRRPPAEVFSHPAHHLSRPSTPERRAFIPIAQASSSPVFCHWSPSFAPDSIRASPPFAPLR